MMKKAKTKNSGIKINQVKCFLLVCFYFSIFSSFAQSLTATLDRDKIVIGEQVILKIESSKIISDNFLLDEWPNLADTINHSEIVNRKKLDTFIINGLTTYQQIFTITSFDSGKWQIGPFNIVLQDKKTGKKIKLTSQPLFLSVLSVDISGMKDYHPIKDIIDVEVKFNWWIPAGIAISILLLAFILYFVINKSRKPKTITSTTLQGTALSRALEKLRHLEEESLENNDKIKLFHTNIDIVCRQYLMEETGVDAMHITAQEIMQKLSLFLQEPAFKKQFQQLMYINTVVKFAKYFPDNQESMQLLVSAIQLLTEIDNQIKQAKKNAF